MKKLLVLAISTIFVLALGAGYAEAFDNGVTDFSGHPYGTLAIAMEPGSESLENSGAGGLRESTEAIPNGITVFSGDSNGVAISQGWGL